MQRLFFNAMFAFEEGAGSMDHHFTLGAMWNQMGLIGKLTVICLLLMSMASIYVMIDRAIAFWLARKQSRALISPSSTRYDRGTSRVPSRRPGPASAATWPRWSSWVYRSTPTRRRKIPLGTPFPRWSAPCSAPRSWSWPA